MDYAFIQKPYILFETVEMLYRFVNGISFRSLLSLRLAAEDTAEGDRMVRQVEQLQEILEETCRGLDPQSPALRRFFARVDTSDKQEGTCLARLLTFSFFTLKETDFWKNVEEIRTNWRYLQEKGAWIQSYSIMSLEFSFGEDCPGDFLDQVCALELPPEFQLNLCRALRSFDKSLDELANLIYPIAQRWRKPFVGPTGFWTNGWNIGRILPCPCWTICPTRWGRPLPSANMSILWWQSLS